MTSIRRLAVIALFAGALVVGLTSASLASELPPGGTFVDDDLLIEEGYIEAIAAVGITKGCNPPANDEYCPGGSLTRAQMASLFVRALGLTPNDDGPFTDVGDSVHARDINAIAAAGITKGCNPPANDRYCPDSKVTRGQIAAFLVRAFDIARTETDFFQDDTDTVFEDDINALAAAGITSGCNDGAYCTSRVLSRAVMAVFMARVLDLSPMVPPERPPPPYPQVGEGKRIIYSNSEQRVWLIDDDEQLVDTYAVSGRRGIPHIGTYKVYSKSVNAWAPYGGITMKHMVRFVRPRTWGNEWAYGFHSIPRYPGGIPMQSESELGTFRSGGCVRQADDKARALYAWADIGTTVHAIP
jgi:hypothetical protein